MTERDKMLSGLPYRSSDPELVALHDRARVLTRAFNDCDPLDRARQRDLLGQLIGEIKGEVSIEPPFRCDYGTFIELGHGFYANFGLVVLDVCRVTFGDNVLCGPNVQVYAATHSLSPEERLTNVELGKPVTIGNNVWLGGGAIVCPGVTIGDHAVIAAGAVVMRDVPPRALVAGNPARVVGEL